VSRFAVAGVRPPAGMLQPRQVEEKVGGVLVGRIARLVSRAPLQPGPAVGDAVGRRRSLACKDVGPS